MEHTMNVSDVVEAGLAAVAKKDNLTVDELIQQQLDYYIGCVIQNYVKVPVNLTEIQRAKLNAVLTAATAKFIASISEPDIAPVLPV